MLHVGSIPICTKTIQMYASVPCQGVFGIWTSAVGLLSTEHTAPALLQKSQTFSGQWYEAYIDISQLFGVASF